MSDNKMYRLRVFTSAFHFRSMIHSDFLYEDAALAIKFAEDEKFFHWVLFPNHISYVYPAEDFPLEDDLS